MPESRSHALTVETDVRRVIQCRLVCERANGSETSTCSRLHRPLPTTAGPCFELVWDRWQTPTLTARTRYASEPRDCRCSRRGILRASGSRGDGRPQTTVSPRGATETRGAGWPGPGVLAQITAGPGCTPEVHQPGVHQPGVVRVPTDRGHLHAARTTRTAWLTERWGGSEASDGAAQDGGPRLYLATEPGGPPVTDAGADQRGRALKYVCAGGHARRPTGLGITPRPRET